MHLLSLDAEQPSGYSQLGAGGWSQCTFPVAVKSTQILLFSWPPIPRWKFLSMFPSLWFFCFISIGVPSFPIALHRPDRVKDNGAASLHVSGPGNPGYTPQEKRNSIRDSRPPCVTDLRGLGGGQHLVSWAKGDSQGVKRDVRQRVNHTSQIRTPKHGIDSRECGRNGLGIESCWRRRHDWQSCSWFFQGKATHEQWWSFMRLKLVFLHH